MNLVIPIASNSNFFNLQEYGYPKSLVEIMGKPMIEHVISNVTNGNKFKKIIFIVRQDECDKFYLDNTLNLLSPIKPEIIKLRMDTEGALCSVLLAIESINSNEPLLISNADQVFQRGIAEYVETFVRSDLDAACLTFKSVHPRWSYVRINDKNLVEETAEKKPISTDAIAGVYFYKKGSDFIINSMASIKNRSSFDGKYFISPVFNEYILANKKVGYFPVSNKEYHTFYSPKKIAEYESKFKKSEINEDF